jgi:hypothetical protein
MWRPHQYTDQLFEASKLLLYRHSCDNSVLKQISLILQHIEEKELGGCISAGISHISFEEYHFATAVYVMRTENKMGRTHFLINKRLDLIRRSMRRNLIPSSIIDTLETILYQMDSHEAEKLEMKVENCRKKYLEPKFFGYFVKLKTFGHLNLEEFAKEINDAKYPVQNYIRKVEEQVFEVGDEMNVVLTVIAYFIFSKLLSHSVKTNSPTLLTYIK